MSTQQQGQTKDGKGAEPQVRQQTDEEKEKAQLELFKDRLLKKLLSLGIPQAAEKFQGLWDIQECIGGVMVFGINTGSLAITPFPLRLGPDIDLKTFEALLKWKAQFLEQRRARLRGTEPQAPTPAPAAESTKQQGGK